MHRKQTFQNDSESPLILFLELSTARYKLAPGQKLVLHYDDDQGRTPPNTPLEIAYDLDGTDPMIIIYTAECTMFHPDGTEAETDYTP